jgi:lipoprotein-anchoring transpeptidase ErfK/SrfK
MKKHISLLLLCGIVLFGSTLLYILSQSQQNKHVTVQKAHWFLLLRKSNTEYFYYGIPGRPSESKLIKTFTVKTGIPGERPTPLPQLVGREYWKIIAKESSADNPETAPYFLTLDVPGIEKAPFGPTPYLECDGQCDWVLPGKFGLHGVNGDPSRLSPENVGSSGCIRHTDEDITYLYTMLDPQKEEIRYYIQDR